MDIRPKNGSSTTVHSVALKKINKTEGNQIFHFMDCENPAGRKTTYKIKNDPSYYLGDLDESSEFEINVPEKLKPALPCFYIIFTDANQ